VSESKLGPMLKSVSESKLGPMLKSVSESKLGPMLKSVSESELGPMLKLKSKSESVLGLILGWARAVRAIPGSVARSGFRPQLREIRAASRSMRGGTRQVPSPGNARAPAASWAR